LRPPNTSLCSSTQEVPSPRALSTPCFEYVFLKFGTQNSVRTCVKLPYVHIYIYRCHIKPVKPHHAVCKKASPNGEPIIGLLTLLSFPVSTSKTKRATAPVNAKIVQYYGPQKIRHKMLELSRIAKFRSNERFCATVIGH
jgi:hypothetical protein